MKSRIRQVLTKEGFEEFKKEQNALQEQRKGAVKNLSQARELGDLSENGFYKAAKSELRRIDGRLNFLSYLLKTAHVVEHQQSDNVVVGSSVSVFDGNVERTFYIVGSYESNPASGKISGYSPIGKALIGKKVGEKVEVVTPNGIATYDIKQIT